jgi:CheY-like chemotaxis protein
MKDKNILVVIENGIIALDIRKQLNGDGYNTEIISPYSKEKIEETLKKRFQLMIIEKQVDEKAITEAIRFAEEYNIPTIYLSTDDKPADLEKRSVRILMMPFGDNDLKEIVKIALGDEYQTSFTPNE